MFEFFIPHSVESNVERWVGIMDIPVLWVLLKSYFRPYSSLGFLRIVPVGHAEYGGIDIWVRINVGSGRGVNDMRNPLMQVN